MLDQQKTCFVDYDSNQESDAEKGVGFSTKGVLEHGVEGNST